MNIYKTGNILKSKFRSDEYPLVIMVTHHEQTDNIFSGVVLLDKATYAQMEQGYFVRNWNKVNRLDQVVWELSSYKFREG